MGKHGNNNKKPKNPDPMSNSRTMGREGMKIIRNIAFGTYNIYTEGQIFRNLDFVNATIREVDKKILEASIHAAAIEYAYANSSDPNVLQLLQNDRRTREAYLLVRQQLVAIVNTYGDTGFLWVLANKLPAYKYNI